jgi:hypothetical protein
MHGVRQLEVMYKKSETVYRAEKNQITVLKKTRKCVEKQRASLVFSDT